MEDFLPPNLWKRQGVPLRIRARRTNKEITKFFNVSRMMRQEVRKELEDNGFDYEVTPERKTHDRKSDAFRIQEFVAEVQKIIDNKPSKSIRAIAREKGVD